MLFIWLPILSSVSVDPGGRMMLSSRAQIDEPVIEEARRDDL